MPDNAGALDLSNLSPEEIAALDGIADRAEVEDEKTEETDDRQPVAVAIVVFQDVNGQIIGTSDVDIFEKIKPLRPAGPDDFFSLCSVVLKDIQAQTTAQAVQHGLMQQMVAMQQQAQEQALRAKLHL